MNSSSQNNSTNRGRSRSVGTRTSNLGVSTRARHGREIAPLDARAREAPLNPTSKPWLVSGIGTFRTPRSTVLASHGQEDGSARVCLDEVEAVPVGVVEAEHWGRSLPQQQL